MFKYLGRMLFRLDHNCPAVLHNIWKARQMLGCLGKLLQREGEQPAVSGKFYRAVFQAVMLFGGVDVSAFSANGAEVRGSSCGFCAKFNKVKVN